MDTNYHILPAVIGAILLILGKCRMHYVEKEFEVTAQIFCSNILKFEQFFNIRNIESVVNKKELLYEHFNTATYTCNSIAQGEDGMQLFTSLDEHNSNSISNGMKAVQTYVNCKFMTIMTKLMEVVELLMELLIKTIMDNKRANKKKLDTTNTQLFGTIVNQLIKFKIVLDGMYFVLNKFEKQFIAPDDQSYVTEAVKIMHLYINRKNIPPMDTDVEIDAKIRRIRYIHLQVQELIDRYEPVNCVQAKYIPYQGFVREERTDNREPFLIERIDENLKADRKFVDECAYLFGGLHGEMLPEYQWVINKTNMSQYDYIKCMWDGVERSAEEIKNEVVFDYRPSSVFKFNNLTVDILFANFFSQLQSYMNVYLEWFSNRKQPGNKITEYDDPETVMTNMKQWINAMFTHLPDGDPSLSDIHARLFVPNQVIPDKMSIKALHLVISTRLNIYLDKIDLKTVSMDINDHRGRDFIAKLKELEKLIENVINFASSNIYKTNNIVLNNL